MKKTQLRLCAPLLVEGLEDRGKVIGGTSRRVTAGGMMKSNFGAIPSASLNRCVINMPTDYL